MKPKATSWRSAAGYWTEPGLGLLVVVLALAGVPRPLPGVT